MYNKYSKSGKTDSLDFLELKQGESKKGEGRNFKMNNITKNLLVSYSINKRVNSKILNISVVTGSVKSVNWLIKKLKLSSSIQNFKML